MGFAAGNFPYLSLNPLDTDFAASFSRIGVILPASNRASMTMVTPQKTTSANVAVIEIIFSFVLEQNLKYAPRKKRVRGRSGGVLFFAAATAAAAAAAAAAPGD